MENIQNKSALIPSDEIRSEELLAEQKFEAFKEHGVFDKNTADSFRKNILEKGGTEDPMTLYRGFRGADPSLEPLLKNRGLK